MVVLTEKQANVIENFIASVRNEVNNTKKELLVENMKLVISKKEEKYEVCTYKDPSYTFSESTLVDFLPEVTENNLRDTLFLTLLERRTFNVA